MDTVFASNYLILIMGITGSGKSSFIADLLSESGLDSEAVRIGHDLESCTASIGFFALDIRPGTRVFLVDTPGFDDTYRSDGEILKEIAFTLAQTHHAGLRLAGIVYLHRITEKRLQGSTVRNLRILECLVGEDAFSCIVLATSMWDDVLSGPASEKAAAEKRESQLMTSNHGCAQLVTGGSRTMRWTRGDGHSARAIVSGLIDPLTAKTDNNWGVKLRIQKEMVDDGRELNDTAAGSLITADLRTCVHNEASESIGNLRAEIEGLRIGLRSLVAEKQQAYLKTLSRVTAEQGRDQHELASLQVSRERLIREEQNNYEALHRLQVELGGADSRLSEEDQDELQSQFSRKRE